MAAAVISSSISIFKSTFTDYKLQTCAGRRSQLGLIAIKPQTFSFRSSRSSRIWCVPTMMPVATDSAVEEEIETADSTVSNTKLYFGNLPYNVDSAQLAGIIQEYASPELIEVLYDRNTGRSRGFAFVTMSRIEDANLVIQNLDGREYGGRFLRVNLSDKPKAKEPFYPETDYKLFVGNLSWSVTSESLKKVFEEYGNVVGTRVLFDGETGKSRGYGFVCYSSKSEMENAIQALNGLELDGRAIRVSLAEGKKVSTQE